MNYILQMHVSNVLSCFKQRPAILAPIGVALLLPPRDPLPPDSLLDRLVSEILPHQHVLLWDDPNPRVSLAQRLERARQLRPSRTLQLVGKGKRLLDEEGSIIHQLD